MSLKKAVECVKRNKKFLVTSHTSPEGDALGAELAFYALLKALKKDVTIVNADDLPFGFDFLPEINRIKKFKRSMSVDFDCLVLLDCSDLNRCGDVYQLNRKNKPILNIDHHISNTYFGEVNFVQPQASSCCEIVYKIFKKMRVSFNINTATFLYIGMLTDTGSFRYSSTNSFTHQAVSELLKYGVDVPGIYRKLYEDKPLKELRILSKLLETVKRCCLGKIVWFELGLADRKDKIISFDLNERLLSFARSIKDIEVAVVFKELKAQKPQIKVSLRSQGKVDVNKIAAYFGGGGHKTASSCTLNGRMPQARTKVLAKIREALK